MEFYVTVGGYLQRFGSAPDGQEGLGLAEGEELVIGTPPGYAGQVAPHPNMRWHVEQQAWVDCRTDAERAMHAAEDFARVRRMAYPPLADLADALYWQAQGDNSRMEAYIAAVAAVKAQHPKVE